MINMIGGLAFMVGFLGLFWFLGWVWDVVTTWWWRR